MQELSFNQKYDIIGTPAGRYYEGQFFTAVKTTGIFCRPACTARKPKQENVEFYNTAQKALQAGYRPCKRCKPMQLADTTPEYIDNLISEIHLDPARRINDAELRNRGLAPHTVRRWFKQHHNMTFQSYQRLIRLNLAFQQLKRGGRVTDNAYAHGYDSISGFLSCYQDVFGNCPRQDKNSDKQVIQLSRFSTPIGPMFAAATEKGLCLLEFTDRRMLETEFADLCKRLNACILPGENAHTQLAQQQLEEYFDGQRQQFSVPLDTPSTPFRLKVWQQLKTIPYGQTRSYKAQAEAIGQPSAVRAVANANGQNRIAIIIPCHRVIGSNGELTGYAGGLARKRYLLALEGNKNILVD